MPVLSEYHQLIQFPSSHNLETKFLKHKQNVMERAFFLEKKDKRIYCVEYLPRHDYSKNHGVILCRPIWGERIRTRRIFTNLARTLSVEGFSVITCDYFGDGNSGGETLDMSYSGMVDNIILLHEYMQSEYQIPGFSLVGFLVGSNIAMDAQYRILDLERMILFEPLLSPIDKMKEALRANLSSQMVVHKKIIKNRDELIEDIKNDIPVNIDGFVIGKLFWESFEKASPLTIQSDFSGTAVIFSIVEKGRKRSDFSTIAKSYPNGRHETIDKEFIWTEWKVYNPCPHLFINTVKAELQT